MRTNSLPWDQLKVQLIDMKYNEKKSLTAINEWLYFKYGRCVTNARLSQLFTAWNKEAEVAMEQQTENLGENYN